MEGEVLSRTIGATSADTRIIYKRLMTAVEGELVTYQELSDLIERDVQTIARGALNTARGMCEREHRIVFDVVVNEGIKRLANNQIPSVADKRLTHIRKTAKRTLRTMACVNYAELPKDQQPTYNARLGILGVLAEAAKPKAITAIESQSANELPVGRVLEILKAT